MALYPDNETRILYQQFRGVSRLNGFVKESSIAL